MGQPEKRGQVEPPVEVCQVNNAKKEQQFVADPPSIRNPPSIRRRRAHRYPPEWRFGPELYQCTLGVILAASLGVRSATKFFGNKKS